MMDRRENNIKVFLGTQEISRTNQHLIDAIKKSNEKQYVVSDTEHINIDVKHRYGTKAKIVVSKKRTLEAAAGYRELKTCVHNFASATNPGGGVTKGSNAQEEAICRCSTLYFNISESNITKVYHNNHRQMLKSGKMNATYNDDCIFTPGVMVIKTDTGAPERLSENEWYSVDVITCAAPNLRERPSNLMNPYSGSKQIKLKDSELLELHIKRMTRICEIAKAEGEEALILGAFGCGAFSNPPRVVAEAMVRAIKNFEYDFKVIEFAVFCSASDTENYDVFKRHLEK